MNIEEKVAEIWKDILETDDVSREDNFLESGGESVMAAMLISRIEENLDVEISLLDFFNQPTFAGVIDLVRQNLDS